MKCFKSGYYSFPLQWSCPEFDSWGTRSGFPMAIYRRRKFFLDVETCYLSFFPPFLGCEDGWSDICFFFPPIGQIPVQLPKFSQKATPSFPPPPFLAIFSFSNLFPPFAQSPATGQNSPGHPRSWFYYGDILSILLPTNPIPVCSQFFVCFRVLHFWLNEWGLNRADFLFSRCRPRALRTGVSPFFWEDRPYHTSTPLPIPQDTKNKNT